MAMQLEGIKGEQLARLFAKQFEEYDSYTFMQPDALYRKNGKWCMIEAKYKHLYVNDGRYFTPKAPVKWVGTGLSFYQFKQRIRFQNETGIKCLYITFDMAEPIAYAQWISKLDELAELDWTKTPPSEGHRLYLTKSKIVIFDINKFTKLELTDSLLEMWKTELIDLAAIKKLFPDPSEDIF